jgi:Fe-S-cluster containining protein
MSNYIWIIAVFTNIGTNALPCPFLGEENKCKIYNARPKDCREFPHTNKPYFASRSFMHSSNTVVCPAVYYIIEKMKSHIE